MSAWILEYSGFDPAREGLREALCTLGNGCLATRGAAPEAQADGTHYPATYVAGVYDRLATAVGGPHARGREHRQPSELASPDVSCRGRVLAGSGRVPREPGRSSTCAGASSRRLARVRDDAGRVTGVTQRRLVSHGPAAPGRARDDHRVRELVWPVADSLAARRGRQQLRGRPLPRPRRRPPDRDRNRCRRRRDGDGPSADSRVAHPCRAGGADPPLP